MLPLRSLLAHGLSIVVVVLCAGISLAAEPAASAKPRAAAVNDFKSTHFLVHTDLPAKEAQELLEKLETMIALVSRYWGRPCAGVIECYVARDLANWPAGSLDPGGRAKIAAGAGVTRTDVLMLGNKTVAAKSVVYATSERGTAQHEAVHAYCGQTFGTTGPLWYAEGMAELAQYRLPSGGVGCHAVMADYLRKAPRRTAAQVASEAGTTGDGWRNYAWRWALCHMLAYNSNYSSRFRTFGRGLLDGQPRKFGEEFAAVADQLEFEYRFFVERVRSGYRVDLCRWDWKRSFSPLSPGATLDCKVLARRGWQPTGMLVEAGSRYEVSTAGQWRTAAHLPQVSADGGRKGRGRLIGVILSDYQLSKPFLIGGHGTFAAPTSGKLYVRCQDAWNELADNNGTMQVRLRRSPRKPQMNADGRRWSTTKATVLNSHR